MLIDLDPVERLDFRPGDGRVLRNGNWATDCPKCVERGEPTPDDKQRFHVCVDRDGVDKRGNSVFGKFHCFRCGWRGNTQKRGGGLDLSFLHRKQRENEQEKKWEEKEKETIRLPPDYSRLREGMHAYEYVKGRGITDEDIRYYRIGAATFPHGGFPRPPIVVFPDYNEDGTLCYWVGRQYTKTWRTAKYLNCVSTSAARRNEIFNLGRFMAEGFKTGVLVEGPVDGIVAGRNHLATLGKPSESQIEILARLPIKRLYIAYDPDARAVSLEVARRLQPYYENLLVPVPRGGDVGDLGRPAFNQLVQEESIPFSDRDAAVRFTLAG
jgi:hypothetical protein